MSSVIIKIDNEYRFNLTIYQKDVYYRESRFTIIYHKLLKIYLVIKINLNEH